MCDASVPTAVLAISMGGFLKKGLLCNPARNCHFPLDLSSMQAKFVSKMPPRLGLQLSHVTPLK